MTSNYPIDNRLKMTRYLNARLRKELDVGLFRSFLELDISEMKDDDITVYFNEARRVVKDDGIRMFTQQLGIFRDCTSIIARIATLASLTNRKSWPILSLTASLPLLDHLLQMIPWEGSNTRHCTSFFGISKCRLHPQCIRPGKTLGDCEELYQPSSTGC